MLFNVSVEMDETSLCADCGVEEVFSVQVTTQKRERMWNGVFQIQEKYP